VKKGEVDPSLGFSTPCKSFFRNLLRVLLATFCGGLESRFTRLAGTGGSNSSFSVLIESDRRCPYIARAIPVWPKWRFHRRLGAGAEPYPIFLKSFPALADDRKAKAANWASSLDRDVETPQ
jgi:hypothetical protein